jgi:hypothetical protein
MTSALDLCNLAWADKKGYVFLSTRNPELTQEDEAYWVDKAFAWPQERDDLKRFIAEERTGPLDLYWAPVVFNKPRRSEKTAGSTNVLYADLDEVDPRSLPKHLKPTAAWQSSPGRYQALWQLDTTLKPEALKALNQRLTYAVGADKGGWGLSKVLRLPGTINHKYEAEPKVKFEWLNGHKLTTSKVLADLPDLGVNRDRQTTISEGIEAGLRSPRAVLRDHKIPPRARSILRARFADVGTRSERLWELECLLAEAGLPAEDIVSLTQSSAWNKFRDRHDEIARLFTEARKAIDYAGPAPVATAVSNGHRVEREPEEDDEVVPITWGQFDRDRKPVTWLVGEIWGEGEVGFISGLPKSYKSWLALDLAVSVATGTQFLNNFQARKKNVLLIQEEDPRPVLQTHLSQVAASKGLINVENMGNDTIEMRYELPSNLYIVSNVGFVVNEDWLELLNQWVVDREIELLILDPLSMIAGDVDEFKLFELMSGLLKPLKMLRQETGTAICIVHHHTKDATKTGGAGMYGSVAFWAWEEAALHLSTEGLTRVRAERFSKHDMLHPITIELGDVNERWDPQMVQNRPGALEDLLQSSEGGVTIDELCSISGLGRDAVQRHLRTYEQQGHIMKESGGGTGKGGRPAYRYRWVRVMNQAVEED